MLNMYPDTVLGALDDAMDYQACPEAARTLENRVMDALSEYATHGEAERLLDAHGAAESLLDAARGHPGLYDAVLGHLRGSVMYPHSRDNSSSMIS